MPYVKPAQGTPHDTEHALCPDVFAAPIWEGSGSTVEDIIGSRTGTITGSASWGTDGDGNVILSHTGSNAKVDFGSASFLPSTQATVVFGYKKRDGTNRESGAWGTNNAVAGSGDHTRFGAHFPWSDGVLYVDFGAPAAGVGRLATSGQSVDAEDDVWVATFGSRGMELWKNGALVNSNALNDTIAAEGNFTFGNYGGQNSDLADYAFLWIYSTQLSEEDIEAISASPFLFFEAEPTEISDAGDIASTAAVGSPTVTGPTALTDAGNIASTAAVGSPTLTASIYDAGGIASTAAVGQPVVAAIKIDDGGGIASTAAVGSPTLTLTISNAGGIASTVRIEKPVVFNQTGRAFTFFIGGVDRSKYVRWGTLDISHQLGSRGTCRMRLIPEMHGRTVLSSFIPTMYDEVIVHHNASGLRLFGGEVDSILREVPSGSADYHEIDLAAIDFGVVLDRIAMAHWYTVFLGSYVPIILRHIVDNFLQGTGITYDGAGPFGGYLGEQLCNWRYIGEFLRQICDEAGLDYRVDVYRSIHLVDRTTGYEAAPFAIEQNDGNWRSLKSNETRGKFANRVIVRNSQDITPLWTDTATLNVVGIYNTTYPQSVKPIVWVDGVEQVVAELGLLGATPGVTFYYIQDGPGLFAASGAPTSGELVIRYPSKTSYVAIAEDAESIAIRGRWDHIEEVRDLTDPDAMQQHADGLLARLGVIPVNLDIETDRAGLEPGQLLSVDANGVTGAFLIEQVQIREVYDTYARWTIRASNAPQRGGGADWFSRLLTSARRQPVDRVDSAVAFVLAETIEGEENPGLSVGVKSAMRFARKSGYAKIARLYFNSSQTTPTVQMVEIDMKQNGVSIFGGLFKMLFPPYSNSVAVNFYFREEPLEIREGDVFTIEVLRADPRAKDGFFELQVQG